MLNVSFLNSRLTVADGGGGDGRWMVCALDSVPTGAAGVNQLAQAFENRAGERSGFLDVGVDTRVLLAQGAAPRL